MAKIILDNKEALDHFYDAMCNIGGTMRGYGLEFSYDEAEYQASKAKLTETWTSEEKICSEDIFKQMLLDGYKLTFIDKEGNGDYTRSIGIQDVYDRMSNVPERHMMDKLTGNDDACTADVILQTVFFEKVVFA